ncbi:DEAD/DEAH box helicase [Sorangium sp. So ce134]
MDFSTYTDNDSKPDVSDLKALFGSLDRKASHVTPRDPQKEALAGLTEQLQKRDLVLKMSTGYGKTTVALVFLYSHMLRTGRPVVYLCPTTQLVHQVLREADNLSIKASYYPPKQSHPDPDATAGKAIIVCTYDKLFNAKTTFDRNDVNIVPEAIVLDDAHSGIQEVRDAFTIRISRVDHAELYKDVFAVLKAPCKGNQPGVWEGIEQEDDQAVLEVPFWLWAPIVDQVRPILEQRYQLEASAKGEKKALLFKWGYLRDCLRWCRCVISGNAVEILPDVPAVQFAKPYAQASHRLFMSATLSDDSALVRELGCDPDAATIPIVPPSDEGVGERMVLAPSLIDPRLDRKWVMEWCKGLASSYRVVVLTPSEKIAKDWEAVGATVAIGDEVGASVERLRAGTLSFAAFAQRYDGVDLPDESCRILVLDGMPVGQGITEDQDRKTAGRTGGAYRRWIYRVEQGMGRAVRSQVDYAVVVLTGPDLVHFLAKRDVVELMGSSTREQLKASEKLTTMAKYDKRGAHVVVHETALQCLNRDSGWKGFYEKQVKKKISKTADKPDAQQIGVAAAEQAAQRAAMSNAARKAVSILGAAINTLKPPPEQVGWLLQRKANYAYSYDPAEGLKTQVAAFEYNNDMCTPPDGVSIKQAKGGATVGNVVLAWYNTFDHPNGAIAALAELKAGLSFDVKPRVLEEALMEVAAIFGASGTRPEKTYRRGPDDLWDWPEFSWIIEAKNDRQDKLPKVDGGQLLSSMEWFQEVYPERLGFPIVVACKTQMERDAYFPEGTRVITPEGLTLLVDNLDRFVAALVQKEPILWTAEEVGQLLMVHKLAANQFSGTYTKVLTK